MASNGAKSDRLKSLKFFPVRGWEVGSPGGACIRDNGSDIGFVSVCLKLEAERAFEIYHRM